MRFAVLVMTDGRDEILHRCLAENSVAAAGGIEYWLHDDTGDDMHRRALSTRYRTFNVLGEGPRRGFGGAIRYAWSQLATRSSAEYVWHREDDFLTAGMTDLTELAALLEDRPYLAQVALKRQPWGREPAGGFMADADESVTR